MDNRHLTGVPPAGLSPQQGACMVDRFWFLAPGIRPIAPFPSPSAVTPFCSPLLTPLVPSPYVGSSTVWPLPLLYIYILSLRDLSKPCRFICCLYIDVSLYYIQTSPLYARHLCSASCLMCPLGYLLTPAMDKQIVTCYYYCHPRLNVVVHAPSGLL